MNQPSPIQNRARGYLKTYLGIIGIIGVFTLGIFIGRTTQVTRFLSHADQENPAAPLSSEKKREAPIKSVSFDQFWDVWDILKRDALKSNVKDTELFYSSLEGMVYALNDPYSVYFRPSAAEEFNSDLSGELQGIGAEIGMKNEQIVVIAPLPNSPAERAGLRPGDHIMAINDESTAGFDVGTAVKKIRGAGGTVVTLTILSEGGVSKNIKITREKIVVPSLTSSLKKGNVAYFKLNQFNRETIPLMNAAIEKMPSNVRGVVLDMRGNPGGMLDVAVEVSSKWVGPDQVVVEEKGRLPEFQKVFKAQGEQSFKGKKTIVLVNKGSASASEIVAGALQDHKLATILGEATFGKGSVQNLYNFDDGSALKLTVAEWFTPLGRNINKEGVKPDIEFKQEWDKEKVGEDKMLDKALEILNK